MNDKDYELKLREFDLKLKEFDQRGQHWDFQRLIWVITVTVAFTVAATKMLFID